MTSNPNPNIGVPSPEYSNGTSNGFTAEAAKSIPRFVTYTSPVSHHSHIVNEEQGQAIQLPLNLIALIIAQIHDVGDLARVCRTSRLLYYMALPQLYQKVHLHSYADIRYVHGRPEGFGSGSPFIMALNGFVTNNHAAIVEEFRIWGKWREVGVEDFVKGRVPDNSMMLNILLRAATDRMTRLRSFSWELDCKPLKTLYQGLTTHGTLTSLTIKFPNSRIPRPSILIPPIPSLRAFRAMDIDPLCYPDDISLLLLASKNLRDLRLHFSPRMRQEAEPTLSLQTYFGRCWKANYAMRLRHFAMQNFFGQKAEGLDSIFDPDVLESAAFFDTFGGANAEARNVFVDFTWHDLPRDMKLRCKTMRSNELAEQHVQLLARSTALEKFYIVGDGNARLKRSGAVASRDALDEGAGAAGHGDANDSHTDGTSTGSVRSPAVASIVQLHQQAPGADPSMAVLGKSYLHALTRHHGSTLRHLLLSAQWAITPEDIGDIVRFCPNLEQLGLATSSASPHYLRLLMPFLPKMRALRVLANAFTLESLRIWPETERLESMSRDLARPQADRLKVIAIGDEVHLIGGKYEVQMEDGSVELRREVRVGSTEDVKDYDIWRMDCADLGIDPVLT